MSKLAKLVVVGLAVATLSGCGYKGVDSSYVEGVLAKQESASSVGSVDNAITTEVNNGAADIKERRWEVGETIPLPNGNIENSLMVVNGNQITIAESWTQSHVEFTYNVSKGQIIKVSSTHLLITGIYPDGNYITFKVSGGGKSL